MSEVHVCCGVIFTVAELEAYLIKHDPELEEKIEWDGVVECLDNILFNNYKELMVDLPGHYDIAYIVVYVAGSGRSGEVLTISEVIQSAEFSVNTMSKFLADYNINKSPEWLTYVIQY